MADLLVDTDVFVDHLRGSARFDPGRNRILYSVVTRAELFAGRDGADEPVRTLLAAFTEVEVDREIAEAAGHIRRRVGIPHPDALIAASAVARGAAVVTRNRRHFDQVPGLRVRAPR